MLNLLLIAPTCDGQDVGEAWAAFQLVRRLAERHTVTVLTYRKRGHTSLSSQLSGLRIVEWQEPPGIGRAERLNSMMHPAYVPFYIRARRWIRQAIAEGATFDLAHQLIPVAMRYPSPLIGLGMPYIIGPVGGSLTSPPGFQAGRDSAPWYVALRSLDRLRLRADPMLRRTYMHADCVLGIGPYVEELLGSLPLRRFAVITRALERLPEPVNRTERPTHDDPVRLLHVGRLVRTKGARETIRAVGLVRDLPVTLDLVGDGFDRQTCAALVDELGLGGRVHLHGRVPREEVEEFYRRADVFVFPSYREPGANVVFEAMGHGLPVVVCDRGGQAHIVDDSCGICVPATSPGQLTADVAAAITRLVENPAQRIALGQAGRHLVEREHLWGRKIEQIEAQYQLVLADQH